MHKKCHQKHRIGIRLTALIVAFVFTLTSVFWSTPASAAPAEVAAVSFLPLDKLAIPAEMGTISKQFGVGSREFGEKSKLPAPNRSLKTVILIQDAHAVIDAQENIRKILGHLSKEYGVNLTALEGAKGSLQPLLLRAFPEPNVKRKVLAGYEKRAELSGPEMESVFQETAGEFIGMEDWPLYQKNYSAYLAAQEAKPALLEQLSTFKKKLDGERSKIYDEKLNEYQDAWEGYLTEKSPILDLLMYFSQFTGLFKIHKDSAAVPAQAGIPLSGSPSQALGDNEVEQYQELPALIASVGYEKTGKQSSLAPLVRKIADDFKTKYLRGLGVKTEMNFYNRYQAFMTGQITSGQMLQYLGQLGAESGKKPKLTPALKMLLGHTQTLSEIKGSRLYDELRRFLPEVQESLIKNQKQRDLAEEYQKLFLLKAMVTLELAHDDLSKYQKEPDAYLNLVGDTSFRQNLAPALEFYKAALERDQAFYQRIESIMEKEAPRTPNPGLQAVAVVAGGFHTNGIERILKEKGIAYAVVTPKIASLAGQENYFKVMKGEVSFKEFLKTTYFDALMRHSAKALTDALPIQDQTRTLKLWRDNVIRELAKEGRITDAGKYLPYIDELLISHGDAVTVGPKRTKEEILGIVHKELDKFSKDSFDRIWKTFEFQLGTFTDGLKQLITKKDVNTQTVTALLDRASQAKPSYLSALRALDPRAKIHRRIASNSLKRLLRSEAREIPISFRNAVTSAMMKNPLLADFFTRMRITEGKEQYDFINMQLLPAIYKKAMPSGQEGAALDALGVLLAKTSLRLLHSYRMRQIPLEDMIRYLPEDVLKEVMRGRAYLEQVDGLMDSIFKKFEYSSDSAYEVMLVIMAEEESLKIFANALRASLKGSANDHLLKAFERLGLFSENVDAMNATPLFRYGLERLAHYDFYGDAVIQHDSFWKNLFALLTSNSITFKGIAYERGQASLPSSSITSDFVEGKSPVLGVSLLDKTGKLVPVILKWTSSRAARNDRIYTEASKLLDQQTYAVDVYSAEVSTEQFDQWEMIEVVPYTFVAGGTNQGFLTPGLTDVLSGQQDTIVERLQGLGAIWALEYALKVRDAKMKHILLSKATNKFFAIDREFLLREDDQYRAAMADIQLQNIPDVLLGEERAFLEILEQQPDGSVWRKALNDGFQSALGKIRGSTEALLGIMQREIAQEEFYSVKDKFLDRIKKNVSLQSLMDRSQVGVRLGRSEARVTPTAVITSDGYINLAALESLWRKFERTETDRKVDTKKSDELWIIHPDLGVVKVQGVDVAEGIIVYQEIGNSIASVRRAAGGYDSSAGFHVRTGRGSQVTIRGQQNSKFALWPAGGKSPAALRIAKKRAEAIYPSQFVALLFGFDLFYNRIKNGHELAPLYNKTLDDLTQRYPVLISKQPKAAGEKDPRLYNLASFIALYGYQYDQELWFGILKELFKEVYRQTGEDLIQASVLQSYERERAKKERVWPKSHVSPSSKRWLALDNVKKDADYYYRHWLLNEGLRTLISKDELDQVRPELFLSAAVYYPKNRAGSEHKNDWFSQAILDAKEDPEIAKEIVRYLSEVLSGIFSEQDLAEINAVAVVPSSGDSASNHVVPLGRALTDLLNRGCDPEGTEKFNIEYLPDAVVKVRGTGRQKDQGGLEERRLNIQGAFKGNSSLVGKTVLIVDDLGTSGETLAEAARAAYEAGAKKVILFAFGKTYWHSADNANSQVRSVAATPLVRSEARMVSYADLWDGIHRQFMGLSGGLMKAVDALFEVVSEKPFWQEMKEGYHGFDHSLEFGGISVPIAKAVGMDPQFQALMVAAILVHDYQDKKGMPQTETTLRDIQNDKEIKAQVLEVAEAVGISEVLAWDLITGWIRLLDYDPKNGETGRKHPDAILPDFIKSLSGSKGWPALWGEKEEGQIELVARILWSGDVVASYATPGVDLDARLNGLIRERIGAGKLKEDTTFEQLSKGTRSFILSTMVHALKQPIGPEGKPFIDLLREINPGAANTLSKNLEVYLGSEVSAFLSEVSLKIPASRSRLGRVVQLLDWGLKWAIKGGFIGSRYLKRVVDLPTLAVTFGAVMFLFGTIAAVGVWFIGEFSTFQVPFSNGEFLGLGMSFVSALLITHEFAHYGTGLLFAWRSWASGRDKATGLESALISLAGAVSDLAIALILFGAAMFQFHADAALFGLGVYLCHFILSVIYEDVPNAVKAFRSWMKNVKNSSTYHSSEARIDMKARRVLMNKRSEALAEILRKEIEEKGSVSFEKFMEVSLYNPEYGYYTTSAEIGTGIADFKTYPEMSPHVFGKGVALQVLEMWQKLGSPAEFQIVEMGAGRGVLAENILMELQKHPELYNALKRGRGKYVIVEISRHLRENEQQPRLKTKNGVVGWVPASAVELTGQEEYLRDDVPRIFISNELPDAFPVHRVKMVDGKPHQVRVAVDGDNFKEILAPLSETDPTDKKILDYIHLNGARYRDIFKKGGEIPVNLRIEQWQKSLANILGRSKKNGYVLTVDYGNHPDDSSWAVPMSVRTYGVNRPMMFLGLRVSSPMIRQFIKDSRKIVDYYRHKKSWFSIQYLAKVWSSFRLFVSDDQYMYRQPGEVDITSDIDFWNLIRIGRALGLNPVGVKTQTEFFRDLGIDGPDLRSVASEMFFVLVQFYGDGHLGALSGFSNNQPGRSEMRNEMPDLSKPLTEPFGSVLDQVHELAMKGNFYDARRKLDHLKDRYSQPYLLEKFEKLSQILEPFNHDAGAADDLERQFGDMRRTLRAFTDLGDMNANDALSQALVQFIGFLESFAAGRVLDKEKIRQILAEIKLLEAILHNDGSTRGKAARSIADFLLTASWKWPVVLRMITARDLFDIYGILVLDREPFESIMATMKGFIDLLKRTNTEIFDQMMVGIYKESIELLNGDSSEPDARERLAIEIARVESEIVQANNLVGRKKTTRGELIRSILKFVGALASNIPANVESAYSAFMAQPAIIRDIALREVQGRYDFFMKNLRGGRSEARTGMPPSEKGPKKSARSESRTNDQPLALAVLKNLLKNEENKAAIEMIKNWFLIRHKERYPRILFPKSAEDEDSLSLRAILDVENIDYAIKRQTGLDAEDLPMRLVHLNRYKKRLVDAQTHYASTFRILAAFEEQRIKNPPHLLLKRFKLEVMAYIGKPEYGEIVRIFVAPGMSDWVLDRLAHAEDAQVRSEARTASAPKTLYKGKPFVTGKEAEKAKRSHEWVREYNSQEARDQNKTGLYRIYLNPVSADFAATVQLLRDVFSSASSPEGSFIYLSDDPASKFIKQSEGFRADPQETKIVCFLSSPADVIRVLYGIQDHPDYSKIRGMGILSNVIPLDRLIQVSGGERETFSKRRTLAAGVLRSIELDPVLPLSNRPEVVIAEHFERNLRLWEMLRSVRWKFPGKIKGTDNNGRAINFSAVFNDDGKVNPDPTNKFEEIIEIMRISGKNPWARIALIKHFEELFRDEGIVDGNRSVARPYLLPILRPLVLGDKDAGVRSEAIWVLNQFGRSESMDLLSEALRKVTTRAAENLHDTSQPYVLSTADQTELKAIADAMTNIGIRDSTNAGKMLKTLFAGLSPVIQGRDGVSVPNPAYNIIAVAMPSIEKWLNEPDVSLALKPVIRARKPTPAKPSRKKTVRSEARERNAKNNSSQEDIIHRAELRLLDSPLRGILTGGMSGTQLADIVMGILQKKSANVLAVQEELMRWGRKGLASKTAEFDMREAGLMQEMDDQKDAALLMQFISSILPQLLVKMFGTYGMTEKIAAQIVAEAMLGGRDQGLAVTGFVDGGVSLDLGAIAQDKAVLAIIIKQQLAGLHEEKFALMLSRPSNADEATVRRMIRQMAGLSQIIMMVGPKEKPVGRDWSGGVSVKAVKYQNNPQAPAARAISGSEDTVLCLWLQNLGLKLGAYSLTAEVGKIATPELKDLALDVARAAILIFMTKDEKTRKSIIARPGLMLGLLKEYGVMSCVQIIDGQLTVDIKALMNAYVAQQAVSTAA